LFRSNEPIFTWVTKDKTKKWRGNSVVGILEDCGYSIENEKKHPKTNNLVIINLISPRIDYRSHSKSNIELKPFAPTISQDIYNFCKSASPRNKNRNNGGSSGNGANEGTMIYHLRKLLIRRYHDVKNNPDLIKKDRWNQSTVFYRLRPILIERDIPVNRKSITGAIDRVCKNDLPTKCKRHEIGIITAARAQFYFDGKSHGVSIDEISNLMEMGTDLVIIEKEGAVEVLGPFADKYGIALLYTRGFLTEYALELSEKTGSNIVILTDFDASGLLLASKLPGNIHRIGVDFQTLEDLDIDIESVQETYDPKDGGHFDALKNIAKNNPMYQIMKESISYLRHYRIEIDSVLAKLDNNELFWDFTLDKLVDIFPSRNYNRSIDVKESIMPEKVEEFFTNITNLISQIQKAEREKIKKELENTDGFIDNIEMKKEEIENRLRSIIEKDNPEIKKILSECEELNRKYFK
jgi:5S rRNA maturation endonuclease (ribonuclease M5)